MYWKGPVFTKNGFVDQTIDLQTCAVSDGFEGEAVRKKHFLLNGVPEDDVVVVKFLK